MAPKVLISIEVASEFGRFACGMPLSVVSAGRVACSWYDASPALLKAPLFATA